ncbi:MAG: hypothetical protein H7Y13_15835 [Sphingobacteriaceae bacterium]|nr:hypothetical protein [Sphingobacteriaceae bacterium]
MKIWIYSLIFSISLSLPAMAQHEKNIESVRAAFITQKLDLSPEESQKFWPVYNNYRNDMRELAIKRNQQRKAFKQSATTPVDDLSIETEMLEIKKRYRQEFVKVLPRQKAAMVYPAEREFMQQLIEHLPRKNKKNN